MGPGRRLIRARSRPAGHTSSLQPARAGQCLFLHFAYRLRPAAVASHVSPLGRQSTKPSHVGPQQACLSRCRIGCASNDAHVSGARRRRQRPSLMPNPIAARRRVAKAVSMQARRSKVENATSSSIRWV